MKPTITYLHAVPAHRPVSIAFILGACLVAVLAGRGFSQVDSPVGSGAVALTAEESKWLAENKVIRVAPDPDFPPFEFFDEAGNYRGIAADYLALIEERVGITFEIVRAESWSAVLAKARAREIDMLAAAMQTPERLEYLRFTLPHISLPGVIIATTDTSETLTLESLRGKKVTVVKEYVWHNLLATDHPDIELVPAPNITTALQMISFRIVDAMVGDQATTTHFISKEGLANLRVAGKSGYQYELALATRKDWPLLNSILDKALATITADRRARIMHRWIQLRHKPLWQKRGFWAASGSAVGAVLLIVVGILIWNRMLSRKVDQRTAALNSELVWRKEAEGELRQHRDHLDQLVKVRTAEVTVANERMRKDLEAAARLQQSMLPQAAPDVRGARFAWHYRPCDELAGDILNVFQLDRTHVGIYVADVSGHGVAASLLSVAISRSMTPIPSKSSLLVHPGSNSSDLQIVSPLEVAQELNRRFPMDQSDGKYFTMVYGILDLASREFRYVSAGHPPIVCSPAGSRPRLLKAPSPAIGWFDEAEYTEAVHRLSPGDRLCIYSDGVSEARNPDREEFGDQRLIQFLSENGTGPLESSVVKLVHKLEAWCSTNGPEDDVSIVVMEVI